MATSKSKSLSWNDRIAIIERFLPTDTEIIKAMGVTQDELDTARILKNAGTLIPTPDLDLDSYSNIFGGIPSVVKPTAAKKTATASTKPAATASQSIKIPKKRGRKGDKILIAFNAIPSKAVPAAAFAADNGVSLAVLRQSKRFDKTKNAGAVRVKKDKSTKILMVWRDSAD